ncbi:MAG: T9SS type A sorting domain-containing protein [Flavobacteriales bacterium]|jgi:hypothetical protein|nr:T9SS type A sorting domain-containing protein [Flavobacteriales bacterium]MBT6013507.1 T9SS type A sorting domain-containing protein [Flavobacteriales bacterium]
MKKLLILFAVTLGCVTANAQCTADPQYQNSTYGIWPDTIQNLPIVVQGQPYFTTLTVKTPATLLEANSGDSSILYIDTLGTSTFVGGWPVDSMDLVQVNGMPTGLVLHCDELDANVNNCMLPGSYLTCAYVDGTTNDPIGIYPIELVINIYTHGTIIIIPISTDLYSALGSYESITGYNIVISNSASYEMFNSNEFTLLQNVPNPTKNNTTIQFNTPNSNMIKFQITDMFGKVVYSENIKSDIGLNTIEFNNILSTGVYTYSVQNEERIISKRMIISK